MSRYSAAALRCCASSASTRCCEPRSTPASCSSSAQRCLHSRASAAARCSASRAARRSLCEAPSTTFFDALPSSTLRTFSANVSDESDSGAESAAGLMLTNMKVFESPPSESESRCVSFELRKGTCASFFCSAAITSPSAERLLLMFCASVSACPSTPDFLGRSLPARSTRLSLPCDSRPVARLRPVTVTTTIECERDDALFILVAVTERRDAPSAIASSTSAAVATAIDERPDTQTVWPVPLMSSFSGFLSMPLGLSTRRSTSVSL